MKEQNLVVMKALMMADKKVVAKAIQWVGLWDTHSVA